MSRVRQVAVAATLLLLAALALRLAHLLAHWDIDWEADSYEHVLQAKYVASHGWPGLWQLIDVWNKPVFTAVASLVVACEPRGWPAIPALQLANSALWLAALALTAQAAREALDSDLAGLWVFALGGFAYLPFRASVSTLTEPSGAVLVAGSLLARQRGRERLSLLLVGTATLARLDAAVLAAVSVLELVFQRARAAGTRAGLRAFVRCAGLAMAPLIAWDALGALHTGRLLFVLGGYQVASPYGRGTLHHFLHELLHYDPAVGTLFLLGLVWASCRRGVPDLLRLATFQAAAYLAVLSVLWAHGTFVAGLLRYLVLAYPCLLLAATVPLTAAFQQFAPRVGWALVAAATVVEVASLRLLVRPPGFNDAEWEALSPSTGSGSYQALLAVAPSLRGQPIYADRAEALYYLGLDHGIYQAPGPNRVRDPALHGVFIYAGRWSDSFGAQASDFAGLPLLAHLPPDLDIYDKP